MSLLKETFAFAEETDSKTSNAVVPNNIKQRESRIIWLLWGRGATGWNR